MLEKNAKKKHKKYWAPERIEHVVEPPAWKDLTTTH